MSKKEREPEYYMSPINTRLLNYNVYVMQPAQRLLCFFILFFAGGIVGTTFYGGLFKADGAATAATYISNTVVFCAVGALAYVFFKPVVTERFKHKRQRQLKVQFRDFLSALSTSLSGGMNVTDSLMAAYRDLCAQYSSESYMAQEVAEMINGIQNNVMIEDSIMSLGKRSGINDIYNFGTVFSVCYRTGGNMKDVVRRSADIICEKMLIAEEIDTKLTSNKTQLYAMLAVPVVLMMMLRNLGSGFDESYSSPVGIVAITIAIALFAAAYKIGSRLMDIKG